MTGPRRAPGAVLAAAPGLLTAVPGWVGPRAIAASWRQNRDVVGNASSLIATTGVASLLGFAYWAFAAHLFSQQAVGYGSAAVSAITVLGTVGMLGLGTVLIGELPQRNPGGGLVAAALLASGLGSLVLGLGFAITAPHLSSRFAHMTGAIGQAAVFVAGVALTGATLVFDQATIGLLRGGLQLTRNVAFAAVKLLLLPAAAVVLHEQFGLGITLSWVVGIAVSLVPAALQARLAGLPLLPRPDWGVLRGLAGWAALHNWLNLAVWIPRLLIPVLVTVVVSPTANAAFYAAWTISGFLYIVPTHLSTVLFAVAVGDARAITRKIRVTLRLSAVVGLPGMVVLGAGAHLILSLFGPSYAATATVPLLLLVIGYLPTVPKVHYIAVCRAAGQIRRAAIVLTAAAVTELAAATVGGATAGLTGLSLALLGAFLVEGLITTPRVVRTAAGFGRHEMAGGRGMPG